MVSRLELPVPSTPHLEAGLTFHCTEPGPILQAGFKGEKGTLERKELDF